MIKMCGLLPIGRPIRINHSHRYVHEYTLVADTLIYKLTFMVSSFFRTYSKFMISYLNHEYSGFIYRGYQPIALT